MNHAAPCMRPDPVDPPVREVRVGGGAVTYTDEGEGPVLVLVHGLPGSVRDFRYLSPCVPECRRIRVDMPGFGGTTRRGRRAWTVEERADLLLAFLQEIGVDRAVLAGHSMGGPVVAEAARRAPERVSGVALLASPGLRPHRMFVRSKVHTVAWVLGLPGASFLLGGALRRVFISMGFPSSMTVSSVTSSLFDGATVSFEENGDRMAALSVPTLVAWAEDDALVQAEISRELEQVVPEGPRLRWSTGGHNLQKTHAAELGAALAEFTRQRG